MKKMKKAFIYDSFSLRRFGRFLVVEWVGNGLLRGILEALDGNDYFLHKN